MTKLISVNQQSDMTQSADKEKLGVKSDESSSKKDVKIRKDNWRGGKTITKEGT